MIGKGIEKVRNYKMKTHTNNRLCVLIGCGGRI